MNACAPIDTNVAAWQLRRPYSMREIGLSAYWFMVGACDTNFPDIPKKRRERAYNPRHPDYTPRDEEEWQFAMLWYARGTLFFLKGRREQQKARRTKSKKRRLSHA